MLTLLASCWTLQIFEAVMYRPLKFSSETWDQISPLAKDMMSR
jgi:hypothetical protein